MGKWVVTVAGIAILSVLCDVILPEGQTRKYVKTVFGVVVSLVIIQPLVGLFYNGLSGIAVDNDSIYPQEQYLESAVSRQNQYALSTVAQLLDAKGIKVKNIQLNSTADRLTLELNSAYTSNSNAIVEQIASAYFPYAEIVTVWSKS
ncbi:MAG: stage III sporulation protein AF [Clostridiales bacterium]|nr:stage III sporulation protein AF [Clostridiales bacterium]